MPLIVIVFVFTAFLIYGRNFIKISQGRVAINYADVLYFAAAFFLDLTATFIMISLKEDRQFLHAFFGLLALGLMALWLAYQIYCLCGAGYTGKKKARLKIISWIAYTYWCSFVFLSVIVKYS